MTGPSLNQLRALGEVFPAGARSAEPGLVVGRERELIEVVQTLQTPGLCPIIFGPKGIGKSTLAWQAELVAKGNTAVLDGLGAARYGDVSEFFYETFWVDCSRLPTPNGESILAAVADHLRRRLTQTAKLTPAEQTVNVSLGLSPQIGLTRRYTAAPAAPTAGIDAEIIDLATEVTVESGNPLLFIVDDLDLVPNARALATFLKLVAGTSPTELRFLLAGTATRLGDLLPDYWQLARIAIPITLDVMLDTDLLRMLNRGVERLYEQGLQFTVEDDLLTSLVRIAAGSPSIASQLARDSIRAAERAGNVRVTRNHLDTALRDMLIALRPG